MKKATNKAQQAVTTMWKKNIGLAALVAVTASMVMVLYPIFMFLLNNQSEFWFRITDVMGTVGILFVAVAAVLFLILFAFSGKRLSKVMLALAAILAAISLCYYIQSNYMISYLPLLTGDDIDWSSFGMWGTWSLLLWIGVPIIFLVLLIVNKNLLRTAVKGSCAVVLAMEVLTLGMTFATVPITPPEDKAAYFSTEGLYELSDEKNVVLIVSDTFEGTFMNDILEQYPEWKKKLSDFTYYDNTTGTSCFTYFAFTKLMTGVDFPIGKNSEDGIAEAFSKQTIVDTVNNNGYDIAYYACFKPTPNVEDKILNYEGSYLPPDAGNRWNIVQLLCKSTLFQGVPHQLKNHFIVLLTDYYNLRLTTTLEGVESPYVTHDVAYRNTLLEQGMTKIDAKPRYAVYELEGVHAPYRFNREFETVTFPEDATLREKQLEGALASLKLLTEYVDALKAAGLYENTTILFTADHGFDMRFYPVMLVKEAGVAKGEELKIDSTPLSMQEDYELILDDLTAGKSFSKAVQELNISEDRVRYALNFRSKDGYGKDTNVRSVMNITGHASKEENYTAVSDEFYKKENFKGKYTLGSAIQHTDNAQNVAAYGFRDNGQIYLHSAYIDIFTENPEESLTYEASVTNITSVPQRLKISLEGNDVAELEFAPWAVQTVSVEITPDALADGCISLGFEAPDATLIHGTVEVLGWSEYYSFAFEEGKVQ